MQLRQSRTAVNLDGIEEATSKRIIGGTAKVLTLDIERLPGLARIWDQKTRFVGIGSWTRLPSLLCVSAKWYDERRILFRAAWDHDDLAQWTWDLYDQADIVVGFNSVAFDNKHLRSEWLLAGMPPPSPWKDVDLYRIAAQHFGFESKSLQHLCTRLELDTKAGHYDAARAEACMAGDATAQRLMKRYNQQDVRITEQAYDRLRPWIKNHPHVTRSAEPVCNRCGSTDLEDAGQYRAVLLEYKAMRCRNCGGMVRAQRHDRRAATTTGIE